jgi:hypothetical protein
LGRELTRNNANFLTCIDLIRVYSRGLRLKVSISVYLRKSAAINSVPLRGRNHKDNACSLTGSNIRV